MPEDIQPINQQYVAPPPVVDSPGPGVVPPAPGDPTNPPVPKKVFSKTPIFIGLGIIALALIAVLIFKLLGGKGVSNQTTLTWWGLWEDNSIVAPIIAEYEKANPKVKINYIMQAQQDYRERLDNALAKGTGPDIFRFHNTWVPMFKDELDFVPASVMSAADFAQTFYTVASSDLTSGTGLVGIPLEYDGLGLYINEDIFSNEGRVPPTTWDDLRITACQLTRIENDVITQSGVALGTVGNVDHWQEILALMMLQNGVNLGKPTGQLAADAIKFFTVFATDAACENTEQKVWDATLPTSTAAFAAGKVAMYLGPSWRAFEIKQQSPDLKFKVVPVPQLPKSNTKEQDITYATYWVEGVWSRSRNKDEAWKFLKYLSEKDTLEKLYQNAARTRLFGEPYPRVDMLPLISGDPIVGGIISMASNAQSWYLASRTHDGDTGINSLMSKYFEDGVNAINKGESFDKSLDTVSQGVSQVLSRYGLVPSQR
jgi:multiple sugar transport system substrate-binding protein